MNIAIIGGSGFIGRHTTLELIKHGHTVTIVDIKKPKGFKRKDLEKITYYYTNALNLNQLKSALDRNIDAVYMFAAVSDSRENLTDIQYAVNTNIMCLTNTLSVMSELKIPRIIFSSTVWVYSICNEKYVTEDSKLQITNSDHIYTTCKVTCEAIIKNFCAVKDVDYTILRYGIAYGPDCHPDTILSKFITNAIEGIPLTITGDGNTFRNFLYVTDHARGNRLALSDKAKNETINLEGPEKITLLQVAERVRELHNNDIDIKRTNERHGDYKGKHVSNSKAKKLLDWEPLVSFKEGSKKLYNSKMLD
jgi:UDP-glucose 4-epimerase